VRDATVPSEVHHVRRRDCTLENALEYKAVAKLRSLYRPLTFYLQICTFLSGSEGIRTPDLRRAKSDTQCCSCSLLFKNACKTANSPL
jgi:hypothetical protein